MAPGNGSRLRSSGADRWFPSRACLPDPDPGQLARLTAHGRVRRVTQGEVLLEAGDPGTRFFVVISGQVDIIRLLDGREELVVSFHSGQFTGEVGVLSGRRTLVRVRAAAAGEVVEVDRAAFARRSFKPTAS